MPTGFLPLLRFSPKIAADLLTIPIVPISYPPVTSCQSFSAKTLPISAASHIASSASMLSTSILSQSLPFASHSLLNCLKPSLDGAPPLAPPKTATLVTVSFICSVIFKILYRMFFQCKSMREYIKLNIRMFLSLSEIS